MNIRLKLFKNESPVHKLLRINQGYGIDQIPMIQKYFYFKAQENS